MLLTVTVCPLIGLHYSVVWVGSFNPLLSSIGDRRKFYLFLCICTADTKVDCREREPPLMELAILIGNKQTLFLGRNHHYTWNTSLHFRNSIKFCQLSELHTSILASRQDLVDRFTSAVTLGL